MPFRDANRCCLGQKRCYSPVNALLRQPAFIARLSPPYGRESWFCTPRAGWRSVILPTSLATVFFCHSGASGLKAWD
ncbi:hypothetical protein CKO_00242 [Citrobacter koseri ATCC BAA-895]|uniref:Uncharacterized protein n=1 Tax=Citrobacter koseri (strain ATCC BAA-895 / CDC 4225-83 / SGSC4696) TaxID=290338 RepID=A8AD43_CITK8|nr:hypothetical protein CKO_00242 [Citrobacter koseri ATCC BAA-895]